MAARDVDLDLDVGRELEQRDGRHARRDRNKFAVVDAYLDLIREGNPRPGIAEVAERSGVSHRSVFRYFADKDELARTSIERQESRVAPMLPIAFDPSSPLATRIDLLIQRRLEFFEVVAPVARLTRSLAIMQPILEEELTKGRSFLRSQVKRLLSPELTAMHRGRAGLVLAAADVLLSFEVADLLRVDHRLSAEHAAEVLRNALTAIVN